MICSRINKYCNDDIKQIENYEKALNDNTQVWDCHHRLETELNLTRKQLSERNLLFNRPPNELILLTHSEHRRLHNLGKPSGMSGKKQSIEHRRKRSKAMKGQKQSDEANEKNRQSHLGKHRVYREDGTYYYTK